MMKKNYLIVEGHGEVQAAQNLITRLWQDLGGSTPWAKPQRWPNLHQQTGVVKAAERVRASGDAAALLILRDSDEGCPQALGPQASGWLADLNLPFPSAFVLFKPEYEVLFLPCLDHMAGRPLPGPGGERPGLRPETVWEGPWERLRGVKEWLSSNFEARRAYKPTTDQLILTRWIDLPTLRQAQVPSVGTLERALGFLMRESDSSGVYPPAR